MKTNTDSGFLRKTTGKSKREMRTLRVQMQLFSEQITLQTGMMMSMRLSLENLMNSSQLHLEQISVRQMMIPHHMVAS
jgi:hypothetical protein